MATKKDAGKKESGQDEQTILDALQAIMGKQAELNERLDELETSVRGEDNAGNLIKLANFYFKPEDKYLSDMSFISPLAARPIAEAMALDEMTSPRVRSGEISLNRLVIENWLHALRGVRGRLLGIGAEAMRDQVSQEGTKDEGLAEFEAGRE